MQMGAGSISLPVRYGHWRGTGFHQSLTNQGYRDVPEEDAGAASAFTFERAGKSSYNTLDFGKLVLEMVEYA